LNRKPATGALATRLRRLLQNQNDALYNERK
jgi:hypothetical protein